MGMRRFFRSLFTKKRWRALSDILLASRLWGALGNQNDR